MHAGKQLVEMRLVNVGGLVLAGCVHVDYPSCFVVVLRFFLTIYRS